MDLDPIQGLVKPAETKIVLLVLDGVGGLPKELGGLTELETAHTLNLDDLARQGICGRQQPAALGSLQGVARDTWPCLAMTPLNTCRSRRAVGAGD